MIERSWMRWPKSSFDNRKSKIQNRKWVRLSVTAFVLVVAVAVAEAQQPTKIPRVGYLAAESGSSPPQAFVQALRDLGYFEGKNIAFEYRTTEGKTARRPDLVADLVRLNVDIIVADGSAASIAAKKATNTIPIVMTTSTDPVGTGLIASLARPGGNVTGLTSVSGELGGKLLELLKEIVPRLSRVIIPAPATGATEDLFIKETEIAARALKIQLIRFRVRGPEDYESIFRLATKERANALLVRIPIFTPSAYRKQFLGLAAKNRLPIIYQDSAWVMLVASCRTGRTSTSGSNGRLPTWTKFSKVRSQATYRLRRRKISTW
jgi:putative tryptophan/tyrosine transport system substrate-binding protein